MVGVAVMIGAFIAGAISFEERVILGFLTGFFLAASSMAFNDFLDREVDAINEPTRPIPSGVISPSNALLYSIFLAVMGFLTAAKIGYLGFSVALMLFAIAIIYNKKRANLSFVGNVMVGLCVSVTFIYGGLIVEKLTMLLVLYSLVAFFVVTGREVVKGIADLEGDRRRGLKTLAVLKGEQYAARVSVTLYSLAVGISLIPALMNIVDLPLYLPFILLADGGLLHSSMQLLRKAHKEEAKRAKRRALLWIIVGLLAYAVGGRGVRNS
jgi:geranylgeranylglycerol-phosphate geranylgeranyltransferase